MPLAFAVVSGGRNCHFLMGVILAEREAITREKAHFFTNNGSSYPLEKGRRSRRGERKLEGKGPYGYGPSSRRGRIGLEFAEFQFFAVPTDICLRAPIEFVYVGAAIENIVAGSPAKVVVARATDEQVFPVVG